MSKTIFDLGSHNTMPDWWDWEYRDGYLDFNFNYCKESWLFCFNNHNPWDCERAAILDAYLWTRRISDHSRTN